MPDWTTVLVALAVGGVTSLVGWIGSARIARDARVALIQTERKRAIYQVLHDQMGLSLDVLEKNPFPSRVDSFASYELDPSAVSYTRWKALGREGRHPEVSPEITRAFEGIEESAKAYLTAYARVGRRAISESDAMIKAFQAAHTALKAKIRLIVKKYEGD